MSKAALLSWAMSLPDDDVVDITEVEDSRPSEVENNGEYEGNAAEGPNDSEISTATEQHVANGDVTIFTPGNDLTGVNAEIAALKTDLAKALSVIATMESNYNMIASNFQIIENGIDSAGVRSNYTPPNLANLVNAVK